MKEKSDAELVALAREGNKEAFGYLVERYQAMVERIAQGMVGSVFIAQELAQEAILQGYLSLDHLRDDARFASWLYGIALNVCRSYLRAQKADLFSLEALIGGMSVDAASFYDALLDPSIIVEERELYRAILQAVQALPPGERQATLLFYYAQLRINEIAAMLGISVVAVKGRLHKARKQLREQLLASYQWTGEEQISQRSRTMVKVSVIDVVTVMKKEDMRPMHSVLVLLDEASRRAMGIWIGEPEAFAIDRGLRKAVLPRPITVNFIASILQAVGATLEEVRIEMLKDDIFYAVARIRSGEIMHEIDARPSDAIALAVVTGAPVFVADDILENCAIVLPEGKTLRRISEEAPVGQVVSLPPGQQPVGTRLVSEEAWEEWPKGEYKKNFQKVLDILMK